MGEAHLQDGPHTLLGGGYVVHMPRVVWGQLVEAFPPQLLLGAYVHTIVLVVPEPHQLEWAEKGLHHDTQVGDDLGGPEAALCLYVYLYAVHGSMILQGAK